MENNYGDEPPPPYTQQYPGYKPQGSQNQNPYEIGGQAMSPPHPPGVQHQPHFASYPIHNNAHTPSYGTAPYPNMPPTVTVQPVTQQVIIVGGCPACRVGVLEDDYTCCGIMCAIFCFPLGILWCLATKQRRCPNCGAIFG
uniref:Membrane protein BRI3 n=1 Tax=Strigamia maritima TaxID=126957 RepID=T1J1W0_STRMM